VLAGAMMLQAVFGLGYAWAGLAPFAGTQSHWSQTEIGLVFAANPIGFGAGLLLGGVLVEMFQPSRICAAATIAFAVSLLITIAIPTPFTLVLFYSGTGIGVAGGVGMAATVAAAVASFPARAGAVGGLLTAVYSASALIYVPVLGRVAAGLGWLNALRIAVITALVIGAAAAALLAGEASMGAGRIARRPGNGWLYQPRFIFAAMAVASGMIFGGFAMAYLGLDIIRWGLGAGTATAAVTALVAGIAAGRLTAGVAADRVGSPSVLVIASLAGLAGAWLIAVGGSGPFLISGAALTGLSFGGPAGLISMLSREVALQSPGLAFGVLFACVAAGSATGPLLGTIAPSGRAVWVVMAAPEVVALMLAVGLGALATRQRAMRPAKARLAK
jgi:MFS family permease